MKYSRILIFFSVTLFSLQAQGTFFDFASLARKDSFYAELKLKIAESVKKENRRDVKKIADGLWASELTLTRSQEFKDFLDELLDSIYTFEPDLQRRILQAVHSLYRGEFQEKVTTFAHSTSDVKLFAMALSQLKLERSRVEYFENLTRSKFGNKLDNPIITALLLSLRMKNAGERVVPPVKDLLTFHKDSSVFRMYMFVRSNRDFSGQIIFRKRDGNFVRDSSGNVVTLPYFARSITNLPGYVTNGNSPQGIFAITGAYNSPAKLIGPTPRIRLFMPSEGENKQFYNGYKNSAKLSDSVLYSLLLPESWRNYSPVYESYYAGKAGRFDIVMHGTTVDQRYYKNEVFYPNVPTHGCLSGIEKWDDKGYLIFSNQEKLLDIYNSLGNPKGYLYLIELDDQEKDVTPEEVQNLLK